VVTHHTNSLNRQQSSVSLRDLTVQSSLLDFINVDEVGVTSNGDLFGGDFTKDTDGDTWTREGVAPDQIFVDLEEGAEGSDFVC
jgi:hypothetical protein